MKKIWLTLGILAASLTIGVNSVYAACESVFSCSAPYDLSNRFTGAITKVTGVNILSEKVAEKILKDQILKNASGKFKVNIDSYSVSDLKAGRFKSMHIHGENVVADKVYFSTLDVNTLCDFNYIVYNQQNKTAIFKEDFPLHFAVGLSESDLNNTMRAAGYEKIIKQVNSFGKAFAMFQISSSQVKIMNNKFIYVLKVALPFMNTTQDMAVVSDLSVKNGEICFNNPQLMHKYFSADFGKIAKALNYLNPLEFSLNVLEGKDAVLNVQNVNIVNNKINIDGTINIPKDVVTRK